MNQNGLKMKIYFVATILWNLKTLLLLLLKERPWMTRGKENEERKKVLGKKT